MNRILVTGSAGTLGSRLVTELRARGHEVTGADLRHWPGEIRTDICEWRQVKKAFLSSRAQICYHLAGEFGRVNGDHYWEQLWRTNCIGTKNIIEACRNYNTRLIFASSSEAYGDLADRFPVLNEDLLNDTGILTIHETPNFHNEY